MRSRPNARHMPSGDDLSPDNPALFSDEQRENQPLSAPPPRRVPRTQMGPPRPRRVVEQHRPILEWTKAILIFLTIVSGFLTFVWIKKTSHIQRKTSNFQTIDKCDVSTYPLWKIDHLKDLNLSGCDHLNLPDDPELWSRFKRLKKLDLNSNSLTDLPDALEVLAPSLEILFLSENKFESVPKVISKLKRLRILSLRGNFLTKLSVSHLPSVSLVWLILTNNQISNIDPNIQELKLLKKLMLSHNSLTELPPELGTCKDLELVRLANNNISAIPESVLSLPKLAWISLSGNPMSKSPKQNEKEIKEDAIQIDRSAVLGKGASGTVYRGRYQGKEVAIKIFKERAKGSDGNPEDEAAINSIIHHPLAMSAIGVIPSEENNRMYGGMVMNLIRGTYPLGTAPSFDSVTRDQGPAMHAENLNQAQVMSVIWNVASALEYIHGSVSVSHGDVYLHNILRDGEDVARLSDWGASFIYDRDNSDTASMIERIEVLAFGRLVQDLLSWHMNVAAPDSTEPYSYFGIGQRGKKMAAGPFNDLLKSILQPDQGSRPTFKTIREKLATMREFEAVREAASTGSLNQ